MRSEDLMIDRKFANILGPPVFIARVDKMYGPRNTWHILASEECLSNCKLVMHACLYEVIVPERTSFILGLLQDRKCVRLLEDNATISCPYLSELLDTSLRSGLLLLLCK